MKYIFKWWMFQFHATPWKINMEPKNEGLEDDFPFQGVISGSMLVFGGVVFRGMNSG